MGRGHAQHQVEGILYGTHTRQQATEILLAPAWREHDYLIDSTVVGADQGWFESHRGWSGTKRMVIKRDTLPAAWVDISIEDKETRPQLDNALNLLIDTLPDPLALAEPKIQTVGDELLIRAEIAGSNHTRRIKPELLYAVEQALGNQEGLWLMGADDPDLGDDLGGSDYLFYSINGQVQSWIYLGD